MTSEPMLEPILDEPEYYSYEELDDLQIYKDYRDKLLLEESE